MYCSKCGEKLQEGSEFCSKCGNKVRTSVVVTQKTRPQSERGKYIRAFGLANVILLLLIFTPWLSVNAYVVTTQFSLLELCANASELSFNLQRFLGSSASQVTGALNMFFFFAFVMLLAMVVTNIADAFRYFIKGSGTISGFVSSLICSAFMIIAVLVSNAYISNSTSSYYATALSSIISTTLWPWIICLVSTVLIFVKVKFCKSISQDTLIEGSERAV